MLLWSSYCSSIGWHYLSVCISWLFLSLILFYCCKICLDFQERCIYFLLYWCARDGCTSFYFQYFWNEWSRSFNSSMGSISLFTLYTSGKKWEQRAHCMWLSYIWNFLFTTPAYALITNFTLFIFSASRILITLVMFVKPLRLDHYITVSKFSSVTFWRIMMWVILSWDA